MENGRFCGKLVMIDIGKATFEYNLDGSAAAGLKVTECVQKRIKS
jgi:hypothetical protein